MVRRLVVDGVFTHHETDCSRLWFPSSNVRLYLDQEEILDM